MSTKSVDLVIALLIMFVLIEIWNANQTFGNNSVLSPMFVDDIFREINLIVTAAYVNSENDNGIVRLHGRGSPGASVLLFSFICYPAPVNIGICAGPEQNLEHHRDVHTYKHTSTFKLCLQKTRTVHHNSSSIPAVINTNNGI